MPALRIRQEFAPSPGLLVVLAAPAPIDARSSDGCVQEHTAHAQAQRDDAPVPALLEGGGILTFEHIAYEIESGKLIAFGDREMKCPVDLPDAACQIHPASRGLFGSQISLWRLPVFGVDDIASRRARRVITPSETYWEWFDPHPDQDQMDALKEEGAC